MQYHAIPCNTMQYNAIPCNTMQYHAIPCIINNCWRSVPLPCGQYNGNFLTRMPSNGPEWSTMPSFCIYGLFWVNFVKDRGYPILFYRIVCQIKVKGKIISVCGKVKKKILKRKIRQVRGKIREGVKKKPNLFGTLSQTMGRWVQVQVQSPKLFSENIHSVIFTANIQKCPKTCKGRDKKDRLFLGKSPKQRTPPTQRYSLGLT